MKLHYERQYGLAHERLTDDALIAMVQERLSTIDKSRIVSLLDDEELLLLIVKQMAAGGRRKIASVLNAWLDYSSARSNLPQHRL